MFDKRTAEGQKIKDCEKAIADIATVEHFLVRTKLNSGNLTTKLALARAELERKAEKLRRVDRGD